MNIIFINITAFIIILITTIFIPLIKVIIVMFSFFEANVDGIVPNEYEFPLPSLTKIMERISEGPVNRPAKRPKGKIWFEPYCSIFMSEQGVQAAGLDFPKTEADIESFQKTIQALDEDHQLRKTYDAKQLDTTFLLHSTLQEALNSLPADKNIFVKDIAHGATGHYCDLPGKQAGFRHTFLIRNPERVFPSWRSLLYKIEQKFPRPRQKVLHEDTFNFIEDAAYVAPGFSYKCQYDLWRYVRENYDDEPVVMDVDEMLANPGKLLPKYFTAVGMPWDDRYLRWDPSPEGALRWRWMFKIDLEQDWIAMVHKGSLMSSEFRPSKPTIPRSQMTPDVIKAVDETMGYYNEMAKNRITV
nr:uncharacterized protein LOC129281610 [Lytechinus pictus]